MDLSKEHIDFIIKDLHKRALLVDDLKDEIIDHVCSAVEKEMISGARFADAYQKVIATFGGNNGLLETQNNTIESKNFNITTMLQNYFIVALRNLRKQRFYTLINVTGLAVGVASCLVILLYVVGELSYDKHFTDYDRIYRVNAEIKFGENHLNLAVAPAPMAEALRKDYPEIEHSARLWGNGSALFRRTEQSFRENKVIYADSSIFKIFDVPFIAGDPNTALVEPATMAISKKAADKYFPGENALGQTLTTNSGRSWKITGVYENMPASTHFHFDFMLSLVTDPYNKSPEWLSNNFATYLKLRPGASAKDLEAKFPKMIETYAGPQLRFALGKDDLTMEQFAAGGNKFEYSLIPTTDIHLHSARMAELETTSDITYVYLFATIAIFILTIACINFMNLSTARSANRAKEVGVRKVMGSMRYHLVRQFLTESVLLSAFSFLIALGLAYAVLPIFNNIALKHLSLPFGSAWFWLMLAAAALVTGILAGLYPSFFLSAFRPVNVLKGNLALGTKSGAIRGGLVVFQFFISIVLVVGTIAVNRQITYIQNKKIGFEKDQVITINDAYALGNQLHSFKEEVMRNTNIKSGTISGFLPVDGSNRSDQTYWAEGKTPSSETMVSIQTWDVDYDYVKTLGMKIKEGRDFSKEFLSDSTAVILNEAAVRMFGFDKDVLGKQVETFGGDTPDPKNFKRFRVVGVVENFHFESLRTNIKPLALLLDESNNRISFSFAAKNTTEIINEIEASWKKFGPGLPFDYVFLNESFGNMYAAELRLGEIFTLFAGLAIIIACLGLFALSAFTAEQRTKEIGIRKVLGASVQGIVVLLSKEFGKLVLIAFILAAPAAWYGINLWLESYTYKTEIGIGVYVVAGVTAFAVAWITMSFQSIKAALANPVKSLRSE